MCSNVLEFDEVAMKKQALESVRCHCSVNFKDKTVAIEYMGVERGTVYGRIIFNYHFEIWEVNPWDYSEMKPLGNYIQTVETILKE